MNLLAVEQIRHLFKRLSLYSHSHCHTKVFKTLVLLNIVSFLLHDESFFINTNNKNLMNPQVR